jgi:hypothetical protein
MVLGAVASSCGTGARVGSSAARHPARRAAVIDDIQTFCAEISDHHVLNWQLAMKET